MNLNNLLLIFPFLANLFLILFFSKEGITIKPIYFYISVVVYSLGIFFGWINRVKEKKWVYIWTIFLIFFGIMALDHLLLKQKIYNTLFQDELGGYGPEIFPNAMIFRGIIPFVLFYLFFYRTKWLKSAKNSTKVVVAFSILYCYYFFCAPFYYTSSGMASIIRFNGIASVKFALLLSTIVIAGALFLFIKKGYERLRFPYLVLIFIVLFLSMHFQLLSGSFDRMRFLFSMYLKYIWLFSGVAYILIFLELKYLRKKQKTE